MQNPTHRALLPGTGPERSRRPIRLSHFVVVVAAVAGPSFACKRSTRTTEGATTATLGSRCASVEGRYAIRAAHEPVESAAHAGTVSIDVNGETCLVRAEVPAAPVRSAVGFVTGGSLAAGWGLGKEYGVEVFTVAGGSLKGTEAENGSSRLTSEDLEGPPGLDGDYRIVRAENHKGKPYTGHVKITPSGAVHLFEWNTECGCDAGPQRQRYVGVGVEDGDKLIVGWGSTGSEVGVVDYKISGATLDGTSATYGKAGLGTELLVRD